MTAKIFQVFGCRELGLDESILHADYNVDCNATMLLRWAGGGFLVLLWPIGLPTRAQNRDLGKKGPPYL
jgi:hypothetical protein